MKAFAFSFICLVFFACSICAQSPDANLFDMSNDELLKVLDNTLAEKDTFEKNKRSKLEHLKNELKEANDLEQRYWVTRNLYYEYSTYDSDSALYYSGESLALAKQAGRQRWIDEMNISRSYILTATGLLEDAQKCIDQVNPDNLDRDLFLHYNEQLLFLYTHKDQYIGANSKEQPYSASSYKLLDNIIKDIPKTDPQYCWFRGWHSLNEVETSREALDDLLSVVREGTLQTVNDAKNAWVVARLYEKIGDENNKLKFMILSAIADLRADNKEIASLEDVANTMYKTNDLARANEYINHCFNCANQYKSRIRNGRIADLQHRIASALERQNASQNKDLQNIFIALICIVLLLLCTVGYIFVQNRRLKASKGALNDANSQLSQRIEQQKELQAQLSETNDKLVEANEKLQQMYSSARQDTVELSETNYAKEKYIADIFAICSNYINKLDDFRRNIHNMLIAHRYNELKEITKNPELSYTEVKELYQIFDRIFLGIYPDFVKDFNSLLRPDEQIKLKKDEQLNTELRIYALVRLGLNDSTKIAQFLHCSVRTVYNTRQRIRNKALVDKNQFADQVKSLGKTAY